MRGSFCLLSPIDGTAGSRGTLPVHGSGRIVRVGFLQWLNGSKVWPRDRARPSPAVAAHGVHREVVALQLGQPGKLARPARALVEIAPASVAGHLDVAQHLRALPAA